MTVTRHMSFDTKREVYSTFDKHKHVVPRLTDEHLSASLEYLYKMSTKEVLENKSKKFIQ